MRFKPSLFWFSVGSYIFLHRHVLMYATTGTLQFPHCGIIQTYCNLFYSKFDNHIFNKKIEYCLKRTG